MKAVLVGFAIAVLMAGTAIAGRPPGPPGAGAQSALKTQLTPVERAQYAAKLARTFEPEMTAKGVDGRGWAAKLGRAVGLADAVNVQNAVRMPTLDMALAVLTGQPVDSPTMKAKYADLMKGGTPTLIGSTIADTTYTPLPYGRCRVADSRVINAVLPAATVRPIDTEDTNSYASQGGNGSSNGDGSTNCGIPSYVTALAVSVTVLTTGYEGFFKIFDNSKTYTSGNTVFFTPSVSASNDVVVTSCQSCAYELSVYASAPVNYVIDVIGYYMPPQATALQCQDTANTIVSVAVGGTANAAAPACPTGYTQTATNCETGSWMMPIVFSHSGICSAKNNDASASELRASRTCCRVPGR